MPPRPPAAATRLQDRSHQPFGARHNLVRRRPSRFQVPATEPPDGCLPPPGLLRDSRRHRPSSAGSIPTRLCDVCSSAASRSVAAGRRRLRSGRATGGFFFPRAPAGGVVGGPLRAPSPFPPRHFSLLVRAPFLRASATVVAESWAWVILFAVRLPRCCLNTRRRCPVGNRAFGKRVPHELPETGLSPLVVVLFVGCIVQARRRKSKQHGRILEKFENM